MWKGLQKLSLFAIYFHPNGCNLAMKRNNRQQVCFVYISYHIYFDLWLDQTVECLSIIDIYYGSKNYAVLLEEKPA